MRQENIFPFWILLLHAFLISFSYWKLEVAMLLTVSCGDRTPVEWMRGLGGLFGIRSRAVEENPTSTGCTPSIHLWGKGTGWCWRSSPAHPQHSPCPWGDAGEPGLILDFRFDLYERAENRARGTSALHVGSSLSSVCSLVLAIVQSYGFNCYMHWGHLNLYPQPGPLSWTPYCVST